jgi:hypothetical protein
MKTKELIRQLHKADPTGEMEVTVGKADIHFVGVQPYYHDGLTQILLRDETNPYYNIIGAEVRSNGQHVHIRPLTIETAIWEDPDLPVSVEGEGWQVTDYLKTIERWRAEARKGHEDAPTS